MGSPCFQRSLSSEEPTPSSHGWPGTEGEACLERPPASALLSTFQRLGVSSTGMVQESKRLRVSLTPRDRNGSRDSPVDIELAQALKGSPGRAPASGLSSPCEEVLHTTAYGNKDADSAPPSALANPVQPHPSATSGIVECTLSHRGRTLARSVKVAGQPRGPRAPVARLPAAPLGTAEPPSSTPRDAR